MKLSALFNTSNFRTHQICIPRRMKLGVGAFGVLLMLFHFRLNGSVPNNLSVYFHKLLDVQWSADSCFICRSPLFILDIAAFLHTYIHNVQHGQIICTYLEIYILSKFEWEERKLIRIPVEFNIKQVNNVWSGNSSIFHSSMTLNGNIFIGNFVREIILANDPLEQFISHLQWMNNRKQHANIFRDFSIRTFNKSLYFQLTRFGILNSINKHLCISYSHLFRSILISSVHSQMNRSRFERFMINFVQISCPPSNI